MLVNPTGGSRVHAAYPRLKVRTMNEAPLNPGDDAAPGTPGTGEDVCPVCGGTGTKDDDRCDSCGGSGVVIHGIGGA